VLNKMPKSVRGNARRDLREIWMAPNRATAERAIETFRQKYAPKCACAVECLEKDRAALLTFFDFPADQWDHLCTSDPIESVFATVRHRTIRKDALSQETARLIVFKLVMVAAKTWRRLKGENRLPRVIGGVIFKDGVEVTKRDPQYAA
jgi:transposase-like protein